MESYLVESYTVYHDAKDMYDISYDELRYRIVDTIGNVLDDAQGYGYKSAQKAHKAWAYKNRTPAQISKQKQEKMLVRKWCKEHKSICNDLSDIALEIAKGSWGPEDKFDGKFVEQYCKDNDINLPVSGSILLKYW